VFIPYGADAPVRRWPIANFAILALLLICYAVEYSLAPTDIDAIVPFVLAKGNLLGLVGYSFVHGSLLHLAGNMLFLWVFGNAVCAKVGNLAYPFIFLALGAVAGLAHLSLNGAPAIGASGAINGIVGMFLVWFPTSNTGFFYIWFLRVGSFHIRSYWMILLWLVFDIFGVALGLSGVAYWAHVGGFAAGFGLAILLLKLGRVRMEPNEGSLLQILGLKKNADDDLGPLALVRPAASAAAGGPMTPASAPAATSLAPPEGYFISFACPCGAELRAPRKHAGDEFACRRCSARTKIPSV
jgi:membrane associated rhomboid family serine protease